MITIKNEQPMSYWVAKYPILRPLDTLHSLYLFEKKFGKCDLNNPPLFTEVLIETYNRCNNDCQFCPANINVDKRKASFMTEKMFSDIIRQLKEIDYKGVLTLSGNNEPLLDKRLEKFIEISTQNLKAKVSFFTNGKLLTFERLKSLYRAGLRNMIIDNYNYKLELLPNINKLLERIRGTDIEKDMNISVWVRYKNARLSNRAGNAPNGHKADWLARMRKCGLPFEQLNINPSGLMFGCCVDVYYQNVVGVLNK